MIPGGHDRITGGEAAGSMIWLQLVGSPGIMGDHYLGLEIAYNQGNLTTEAEIVLQFAILVPEKGDLAHTQNLCCLALLLLPQLGQSVGGNIQVFGPFITAGEDEISHFLALRAPSGHGPATGYLRVVWMCHYNQYFANLIRHISQGECRGRPCGVPKGGQP